MDDDETHKKEFFPNVEKSYNIFSTEVRGGKYIISLDDISLKIWLIKTYQRIFWLCKQSFQFRYILGWFRHPQKNLKRLSANIKIQAQHS